MLLRLKKPVLFCNPVAIIQIAQPFTAIKNPSDHLECYKTSDVRGQARFVDRNVFVRHRWGTTPLTAKKSKLFCLPTTLVSTGPIP